MNYVMYFLAAFGFAYVIGHSKISLPFREVLAPPVDVTSPSVWARHTLLSLMECAPCCGFWTGIVTAKLGLMGFTNDWPTAIILGFITVATNLLAATITKLETT